MSTKRLTGHNPPRELRPFRALRNVRFELFWMLVVGGGLFLLVHRFSARLGIDAWLRDLPQSWSEAVFQARNTLRAVIEVAATSDWIIFAILVGATGLILMRIRWRILHSPRLTLLRCPRCGNDLHRIHRTFFDRALSAFVPVRRYHCDNHSCGWGGRRYGTGHVTTLDRRHTSG